MGDQSWGEIRPPAQPADRLLAAPTFILSAPRSGSTLLRAIAGSHSKLHAVHELHLPYLGVRLPETGTARLAMEHLGHNHADLEHLLWDRVLHRELTASGKQWIVVKDPASTLIWQRISTCWPDARFVILLRHPAAIVASWQDSASRGPQAALAYMHRFMVALDKARTHLAGLTVRYEQLTADPAGEVARICQFLAVPFEPGMLRYQPGDPAFRRGLGDWRDKIHTGAVQPPRPIPDHTPPELHEMSAAWGY